MSETIARRYVLRAPLGRGAHGEVFEADDLLTGLAVAVKLLHPDSIEPARFRREVAALRLIDVPGVVRLLDEGIHDGRPFVVTHLATGRPFPGEGHGGDGRPASWSEISDATISLFETLDRIHAVGIVHRDLKPDNVLVDGSGRVTVLDFGLAVGDPIGSALTVHWAITGTPAYLAPEQLTPGPVTPRTDLFSVGVMLYEALTGRNPHQARDFHRLARARLEGRHTPIAEVAPHVPPPVAEVIGWLLLPEAERRPASAKDVLRLLRGELAESGGYQLPPLGGDVVRDAIVEALNEGRSVELVGRRGSGRSYQLRRALGALGPARDVVFAAPAQRPFASLWPLISGETWAGDEPLDRVLSAVTERVRARLDAGTIVVCDPEGALDPWSRRVLAECLDRGGVVRVREAADPGADAISIAARPLSAADLRDVFVGPDRIFHRREDAARELHRRTEGVPRRVEREVAAWIRAGFARVHGALLDVERPRVDRLRLDERAVAADDGAAAALPARLAEPAAWVHVAGRNGTPRILAAAMAQPLWLVEAMLAELEASGEIHRGEEGWRCRSAGLLLEPWSREQIRDAHHAVAAALPLGAEGRWFHLLASIDDAHPRTEEIADEATHSAAEWARQGRLGLAGEVLAEAAGALRVHGDDGLFELRSRLFALWVEIVLADRSPRAMDRVLYELERAPGEAPRIAHMKDLVHAALTLGSDDRRALALLGAMSPVAPLSLERRRHQLMMVAARSASLDEERRTWERACAFAAESGDALAMTRSLGWTGRLRYREGRYDEAAALFAESARGEPWLVDRLAAELNAASASLEAFRLEEARGAGLRARALAAEGRHAFLEVRAEWLVRAAEYRAGRTEGPDMELVAVTGSVFVRDMEALVAMTEAAAAFRARDAAVARALARRAIERWSQAGLQPEAVLLMRALEVACGAPASPEAVEEIAALAAAGMVPGMGIQSLGLLALGRPGAVRAPDADVARLSGQVPRGRWADRLDVLSVDEALSALRSG